MHGCEKMPKMDTGTKNGLTSSGLGQMHVAVRAAKSSGAN